MDIAHNFPRRQLAAWLLLLFAAASIALATPGTARANAIFGTFWVDLNASQPQGLSPANGSDFVFPDQHVQLSWQPVGGARRYHVQVSRDSSFRPGTIITSQAVNATKYVPTALLDDGVYWWRVRARDGKKYGTWSSRRSFEVAWGGLPSNLRFLDDDLQVATSAELGGVLSWSSVAGATAYDVQVSQSAGFAQSAIIVSSEDRPHTKVVLPRLPDDTYWWRVRTVDASGNRGAWVEADNSFEIQWVSINSGGITPADSAAMTQWRLGWDPVVGAARYQVQAAAHPGCFFDPDKTETSNVPDHSPGENAASPIGDTWCRISHERHDETINNFMTSEIIADREIYENTDLGSFTAVPPYRWGDVWWRVRPVQDLRQSKETLWDVGGTIRIRGEWSKTPTNQPYHFTLGPAAGTTDGAVCPAAINPSSPGCLSTIGTTYSATNPSDNSSTMQMPLMEWLPFDTNSTECDRATDGGADGSMSTSGTPEVPCYGTIVQVATDEAFDTVVWEETIRDGKAYQGSSSFWKRSADYNMSQLDTTGGTLPDNQVGTGYWWRAVPCIFYGYEVTADNLDAWRCVPAYYIVGPGTATGTPGMGARMFTKRADFGGAASIDTIENYAGRAPLLKWERIHGADYYEVELAQDSKFAKGRVSLKTTASMMIPHQGAGESELANGKWWWRVRALDANGINTSWSVVRTFTKSVPAPSPTGPANGASRQLPTLTWSAVNGSTRYQVQYSRNSEFTGTGTRSALTNQTGYVLDAQPGTWYWRVRAYDMEGPGTWSSSRRVVVLAADELLYELNRRVIRAGKPFFVRGELYENGSPASSQVIRLERRASGGARYKALSRATTGKKAETGVVRLGHKPKDNGIYRLARRDGGRWHRSAPFKVLVQPVIKKASFSTKKLRRGKTFSIKTKLNRKVSGMALVEYRYKGKWRVAGRKRITRAASFRVKARVNRSGVFKLRMRVTKMGNYYNTSTGTVKVRFNDVWTYYTR